MRKLLLFGLLFLTGYISKAQKVYFVYLESEKAAPFYVKMGDKVFSSSTAGYLILSNLKDSTYTFSVGFVGKRDIEPKFQVAVSAQDHGYLLKELDQKLNLFDLQSLELIAPMAAIEIQNDPYITRTDKFTRTLSQAANDPSLLLEVVRKEPVKSVTKNSSTQSGTAIEQAVAKESIVVNSASVDTITRNQIDTTALAVAKQEGVDTTINKIDTVSVVAVNTTDSSAVAAIDNNSKVDSLGNGNKLDTVSVADTATKKAVAKVEDKKADDVKAGELNKEESKAPVVALKVDSTSNSQVLVSDTVKVAEPKGIETEYKRSTIVRRSESSTTQGFGLTFIDYTAESSDTIHILIPNQAQPFRTAGEPKPKEQLKTIPDIEATAHIDTVTHASSNVPIDSTVAVTKLPSSCTQTATERDFRSLRKEMASLETDEGMINTAVLAFREKCFTTEQVKNLSTLFLSAQWKYQFFEAAQKYIADADKFATLESEIKDEYYVNRFKALLAK
ncbi:hypothetical protein [Flavisolibacter tropicus]|uniref:DUF4476 domain-containing protein n=1 Tax=Flavisolibacter tropicus TaxID=1492898 RepID=A0A172TTA3_9BACT|nr:hypothetical protein [Flavisolibacter tropicus]ANE50331.1 hypothetical protein SY85_07280 [Flavisolibacter tropicus]